MRRRLEGWEMSWPSVWREEGKDWVGVGRPQSRGVKKRVGDRDRVGGVKRRGR